MNRIKALDFVFKPESVAFVGASNNFSKWGFIILHNLMMGGYKGKIYPVNPKEKEILGLRAYSSVLDIPDEVELAIFTIPAKALPDAISDCVKKRIKAGVVISAGFSELGDEGKELEEEMVKRAKEGGMVLVGPNGQGVACPRSNFYPWMPAYLPRSGSISIISQSGNILTWLIQGLENYGFGVAKAVSAGNASDISWDDYLVYLEQDEETKVILLYMEGLKDGRNFIRVAREVARSKPIILLKAGKSEVGIRAARSHTGVLAGEDKIFSAVCKQAGIIRVNTMLEAVCISAGFVATPLPKGNRLGIITGGGGLGVIASDLCAEYGVEVPELSQGTIKRLKELLPPWWVPGNPVDLVAGIGYAGPKEILPLLIESGEVDGVLLIGLGWAHTMVDFSKYSPLASKMDMKKMMEERKEGDRRFCQKIKGLIEHYKFPIILNSQVASRAIDNNFQSLVELLQDGIMLYPSIELAVQAFSALSNYYKYKTG